MRDAGCFERTKSRGQKPEIGRPESLGQNVMNSVRDSPSIAGSLHYLMGVVDFILKKHGEESRRKPTRAEAAKLSAKPGVSGGGLYH